MAPRLELVRATFSALDETLYFRDGRIAVEAGEGSVQFRYGDDAPWISADAPGVKFISVPITDGAYHLQARKVDAYGRAGEVATLDYVLDREAPMPVVYFLDAQGAQLPGGAINLHVIGVADMEEFGARTTHALLDASGQPVANGRALAVPVINGRYRLLATTTDLLGNLAQAEREFVVDLSGPSSWAAPIRPEPSPITSVMPLCCRLLV